MSGHTPGPWIIVPPDIEGWHEYGFNVWAEAVDDEDKTLCHDVYSEADAHLIAASPELLEAAKQVADVLKRMEGPLTVEPLREMDFTRLLNAIDDAEGKS